MNIACYDNIDVRMGAYNFEQGWKLTPVLVAGRYMLRHYDAGLCVWVEQVVIAKLLFDYQATR